VVTKYEREMLTMTNLDLCYLIVKAGYRKGIVEVLFASIETETEIRPLEFGLCEQDGWEYDSKIVEMNHSFYVVEERKIEEPDSHHDYYFKYFVRPSLGTAEKDRIQSDISSLESFRETNQESNNEALDFVDNEIEILKAKLRC
jgi:hypothetical protein